MSDCLGFKQSYEKGSSLIQRDACLRCGRTKEYHEAVIKTTIVVEVEPAGEIADKWLFANGYSSLTCYDMLKSAMVKFIKEQGLGV